MPDIDGCDAFISGDVPWPVFKEWLRLDYDGVIRVKSFSTRTEKNQLGMKKSHGVAKLYKDRHAPWALAAKRVEVCQERAMLDEFWRMRSTQPIAQSSCRVLVNRRLCVLE